MRLSRGALTMAGSVSLVLGQDLQAAAPSGHIWTVRSIIEVPRVVDVAISTDAGSAAYIVHRANVAQNREYFELHLVSIGQRRDRVIATADWLGSLHAVPRQAAWSLLGDFGQGVQLYSFDMRGRRKLIVNNPRPVLVGNMDGAVEGGATDAPLHVGILAYAWSASGETLFYSSLERGPQNTEPLMDDDVVDESSRRRWGPNGIIRFFVRHADGRQLGLAVRPGTDRVARYLGGLAQWEGTRLYFSGDDGVRWTWRPGDTVPLPVRGGAASAQSAPTIAGPLGGDLATKGFGGDRHLVETTADNAVHDYGPLPATINDPRSPGAWRSPRDGFAVVAVRMLDHPRYALITLDRSGRRTLIEVAGSLTNCTFDENVEAGACVRQGLTDAPRLVMVDPRRGRIEPIVDLAPDYRNIPPLRYSVEHWTNSLGYTSGGFIIYPRNYRSGVRYPLIIVTHGSDADERFVSEDMQWHYPVQVLAERGYVVALVNDPSPMQDAKLMSAYAAWSACGKGLDPTTVQNLVWLGGVDIFKAVITHLAETGIVDAARVGIAGYSRGSQMVNVAMTQTDIFKAASSGDGAYLEPAAYRYNQCGYNAVFGGPPGNPAAYPLYRRLAPSYRGDVAKGALLQQMAEPRAGAVELFQSFRAAGLPTRITLYPGESSAADETHVFHIPKNKRGAMEENIAWFDRWLGG